MPSLTSSLINFLEHIRSLFSKPATNVQSSPPSTPSQLALSSSTHHPEALPDRSHPIGQNHKVLEAVRREGPRKLQKKHFERSHENKHYEDDLFASKLYKRIFRKHLRPAEDRARPVGSDSYARVSMNTSEEGQQASGSVRQTAEVRRQEGEMMSGGLQSSGPHER